MYLLLSVVVNYIVLELGLGLGIGLGSYLRLNSGNGHTVHPSAVERSGMNCRATVHPATHMPTYYRLQSNVVKTESLGATLRSL